MKNYLGADAYPVFVMYEQLNAKNLLNFDEGLDRVWENCVVEYQSFRQSEYNDSSKSEYCCIVNYVEVLANELPLINQTLEEVVAGQVKLINYIQETANLNIINCCKCGSAMIHNRADERIKCICGEIVHTQDCEDLWYEGYYPKSEEQTKQY